LAMVLWVDRFFQYEICKQGFGHLQIKGDASAPSFE
jgi:hypothetical protein